jgi:IS5 family transposase
MQVVADRLSLRWYLGYDLSEPLPDHSSLTRIRQRYGLEVFHRFFETIVAQCLAAGLVWGKELYFDVTNVEANACSIRWPRASLSRRTWVRSSPRRRCLRMAMREGMAMARQCCPSTSRLKRRPRWPRLMCVATTGSARPGVPIGL